MSAALSRPAAGETGERGSGLAVGDLVRTGRNFYPHYRVIALTDDRAWVRDVNYRTDHIVPIDRCSRIPDGASAPARRSS